VNAVTKALSETELAVVRATEPDVLAGMKEDDLIDLHARVRRGRDKYTGLYRRQASERVAETGGRGAARPGNRRAADRAEVFEVALARVSTALARAARQTAAQLKAERIAAGKAARASAGPASRPAPPEAQPAESKTGRPPAKSTGRRKRDASSLAAGARRQAKRDSR
jgi:hypothetical protein